MILRALSLSLSLVRKRRKMGEEGKIWWLGGKFRPYNRFHVYSITRKRPLSVKWEMPPFTFLPVRATLLSPVRIPGRVSNKYFFTNKREESLSLINLLVMRLNWSMLSTYWPPGYGCFF
jgi:hypothetical protein